MTVKTSFKCTAWISSVTFHQCVMLKIVDVTEIFIVQHEGCFDLIFFTKITGNLKFLLTIWRWKKIQTLPILVPNHTVNVQHSMKTRGLRTKFNQQNTELRTESKRGYGSLLL